MRTATTSTDTRAVRYFPVCCPSARAFHPTLPKDSAPSSHSPSLAFSISRRCPRPASSLCLCLPHPDHLICNGSPSHRLQLAFWSPSPFRCGTLVGITCTLLGLLNSSETSGQACVPSSSPVPMENPRTTRPAASNGSLNAAYNAQARLGSLSSAGSRRHLRSVHENAALLPSPGPLESMLKTTTETGDIGVFSIRPIASSATFNQLPRERSAYWDDTLRPRRRSGSGDGRCHAPPRTHVQDDRRRLPSYQDAASDIISMYEPETQQPAHSLLSPPFDDQGLRSYSMTSYGSKTYSQRPPARRHHGGTMPPFLQRPRSPYPYPTRLKRPGVRPSSPALTENGNIDYSRMIGIDRVSHVRTPFHVPLYPKERVLDAFSRSGWLCVRYLISAV